MFGLLVPVSVATDRLRATENQHSDVSRVTPRCARFVPRRAANVAAGRCLAACRERCSQPRGLSVYGINPVLGCKTVSDEVTNSRISRETVISIYLTARGEVQLLCNGRRSCQQAPLLWSHGKAWAYVERPTIVASWRHRSTHRIFWYVKAFDVQKVCKKEEETV